MRRVYLLACLLVTGCYTYYPVEVDSLGCDSDAGVIQQSDQCRDAGKSD